MMLDAPETQNSINRVDAATHTPIGHVNGRAHTASPQPAGLNGTSGVETNCGHLDNVTLAKTEGELEARSSKKRKFDELTQRSRSTSRAASPPWKSFAADGPTQFTEDGKRRSGRVNYIPLDLQPPSDKRTTRRAHESAAHSKQHQRSHSLKGPRKLSSVSSPLKKEDDDVTPKRKPDLKSSSTGPHRRKWSIQSGDDPKPTRISSRVKVSSKHFDDMIAVNSAQDTSPPPKRRPGRPPNSARKSHDGAPSSPEARKLKRESAAELDGPISSSNRSPRLRLKFARPVLYPRHPGFIPRPSTFGSLVEVLDAYDVKEKEQGPGDRDDADVLDPKPAPRLELTAEEAALNEARSRLRVLDASKPGRPLSREACSLFFPDTQDQAPRQYSHNDHLWAHGAYFRTLLNRERAKHMDLAKKTAHACLAKWKERQPQTAEEREKEENEWYRLMYKQTVKDIHRKWELIVGEIERRRLATYMEEQELTRDLKMQRLLEDTTEMLNRRRVAFEESDAASVSDGDASSDATDEGDDDTGSDEIRSVSEDDDNMSTSESESEPDEEVAGDLDETLSPEALKAKYANLPKLEMEGDDGSTDHAGSDDGSVGEVDDMSHVQLEDVDDALMDDEDDDSTDMSDDMGSSDDESDSEDASGEDEDEDGGGLMGFFAKPQRQEMHEAPRSDNDGAMMEESGMDSEAARVASDALNTARMSLEPRHEAESADLHAGLAGPEGDHSSQPTPMDDSTAAPTEADSTTTLDPDEIAKIMPVAEETHTARKITTKVPSLLRGQLREYQHYGLDWLAKLYVNQTNGILADEMGLGKTIQTIALLAHLAEEHEVWGPHLIVVPTSVILNWEMEFKKFLPGFKVLSYYGTQEERQQKRKGWSNPDNYNVVITSYQLILKDLGSIRVPEWHYMILDEAHNIKNFQSQRYQAMIRLKTHARLLLTGTPLQNSIQELWSLLTFLTAGQDGQGMGDLDEFTQWFKRPVDEIFVDGRNKLGVEAQEIVNKLHHSLRPYILRRMKSQVEKQLPAKYEHTVFCRLSKRQRQLYDAFLSRADVKEKLSSGNPISVSQALMALRKVCNHPDLFEERPIVTSFTVRKPYSRMPRSVIADYEIKDLIVRRRLLADEGERDFALQYFDLQRLEPIAKQHASRGLQLNASKPLHRWVVHRSGQRAPLTPLDGSSLGDVFTHVNHEAMTARINRLETYINVTTTRAGLQPIFGHDLIARCTIRKSGRLPIRQALVVAPESALTMVNALPVSNGSAPANATVVPKPSLPTEEPWLQLDHLENMNMLIPSLEQVGDTMHSDIEKFGFVTPHAVAQDVVQYLLPGPTRAALQGLGQSLQEDPFHEARIRLSIAFPDKRLLQYDCGKLQRLAILLRELTDRGSRALIFTQMTSVLDILERFLNIHGYKYMRLDGSTRIEQRQDMMERFNRDERIDVFILSSRSGGVGMNLTGADSVIFYDLDWNPQMDKQCQDRAHRIGQTRDVHIYKLVSEHTIEVNILKKSNQKRMLDEVVIQEGEFTTDRFNKTEDQADDFEIHDAAGAAVDRVLGLDRKGDVEKVLAAAEERVDIEAANAQQKEAYLDDADFDLDKHRNKSQIALDAPATALAADQSVLGGDVGAEQTDEVPHIDEYMLRFVQRVYDGVAFVPPLEKNRSRLDKNGRDRSHRPKRR